MVLCHLQVTHFQLYALIVYYLNLRYPECLLYLIGSFVHFFRSHEHQIALEIPFALELGSYAFYVGYYLIYLVWRILHTHIFAYIAYIEEIEWTNLALFE